MESKNFDVKVLGSVAPYSKGNKNCPGFLVNYGDKKILLDSGNGITRLLNLPEDLNNMHIFISHFHKDHYGDLLSLGPAMSVYHSLGMLKDRVKLYIPEMYEPKEFENFYSSQNGYHDYLLIKCMKDHYFEFIKYNQRSRFDIDGLNISFMENKHDVTCYSTKLEDSISKLTYTGDTGYEAAERLINFSSNSDLLIAESSLLISDNKFNNNHLHAYQSAEIARYARVKKLLLTHFWPEHNPIDYLNEAKPIFENTEVAEEGKVLKLR